MLATPRRRRNSLAQRLAHQPQLEILEIAQASMHQLGAGGAGGVAEVALFDQRDLEAAHRRVARDAAAGDAAADDENVENLPSETGEIAPHGSLPGWALEGAAQKARGGPLSMRRGCC